MREELKKYTGLIYRFDGKGDTVNCCKLARIFYADHGWKEDWDDGKPWPKGPGGYEDRLRTYMDGHFLACSEEELEYGDVVMLDERAGGGIGVYVGSGELLCLERPFRSGKSKTTVYEAPMWKPYVKAEWKRIKEDGRV